MRAYAFEIDKLRPTIPVGFVLKTNDLVYNPSLMPSAHAFVRCAMQEALSIHTHDSLLRA